MKAAREQLIRDAPDTLPVEEELVHHDESTELGEHEDHDGIGGHRRAKRPRTEPNLTQLSADVLAAHPGTPMAAAAAYNSAIRGPVLTDPTRVTARRSKE